MNKRTHETADLILGMLLTPLKSARRLSNEEVANITQHKSLKKTTVKSEMMLMKDAAAPQSVPNASPK